MQRKVLVVTGLLVAGLLLMLSIPGGAQGGEVTLLNVSYDPTRELYQDFNQAFAKYWKAKTGQTVNVEQSHGGSSKQARAVIDGLAGRRGDPGPGLRHRRDFTRTAACSPRTGRSVCPHNSTPYTSTIVFLVRKGNPKHIKDWDDLVKPGISVITPNPKTSGGARWNYLAAWAYALKQPGGNEAKAQGLREHASTRTCRCSTPARAVPPPLLCSARSATCCIAWENEAFLSMKELGPDKFEIVVPSISILAEPPVAIVDKVVDKNGTRKVAQAYLEYLYTPEGQEIAAKNYYRPRLDSRGQEVRFYVSRR